MLGGESQRRVAVGRFQDHVAEALEYLPGHHADRGRILDHEHGFRTAAWLRAGRRRGGGFGGLVHPGEGDFETRPLTGLRGHPNESARLVHDTLDRFPPQPNALAPLLGPKTWTRDTGP